MEYKINIHAHTLFSDGMNTPISMAVKAKELGFSALVITDHYYGGDFNEYSLNLDKYRLLKKACKEAKNILPVIIGMEVAFYGEEVLCFGGGFIRSILECGEEAQGIVNFTMEQMMEWKRLSGGAVVLCHPGNNENWKKILPLLDGFEHYNSGQNWFSNREFGVLSELTSWCNSDAHQIGGLDRGYNIVSNKIEKEHDLINYIKSRRQPKFHLRPRKETENV